MVEDVSDGLHFEKTKNFTGLTLQSYTTLMLF